MKLLHIVALYLAIILRVNSCWVSDSSFILLYSSHPKDIKSWFVHLNCSQLWPFLLHPYHFCLSSGFMRTTVYHQPFPGAPCFQFCLLKWFSRPVFQTVRTQWPVLFCVVNFQLVTHQYKWPCYTWLLYSLNHTQLPTELTHRLLSVLFNKVSPLITSLDVVLMLGCCEYF